MPPPIPRIDERNPITEPAKIDLGLLGLIFLDVIFISNRICNPTSKTNRNGDF